MVAPHPSRVVVTGASGHVGAALVRALLEDGAEVCAVVRSDVRALRGLEVDLRKVDVTDGPAIRDAVRGAEVVYHAAARITLASERDDDAERVNVVGTRHVVDACREHGVRRLVHFSTVHALDASGALLAEGAGLPYERSKAGGEREVTRAMEAGLDAVIVSPCAVLGPYDHKPSFFGRVLLMLARGWLPATVLGGQSWVDVRDIARGAIRASAQGERGGRYVLAGHWLRMHELATIASHVVGVRPPRIEIPVGLAKAFAPLAERAARAIGQEPLFSRASMEALEPAPRPPDDAAARVLGHAPRPVRETLTDTFRWFEEAGLLRRRSS